MSIARGKSDDEGLVERTVMQKPSELELKILSVLWDHGPQTVRSVLELLPDGKQRA